MIVVTQLGEFFNRNGWSTHTFTFVSFLLTDFNLCVRVGSEASEFNFAGTHSSIWINNNCQKWTESLQISLIINIDSTHPASVSWMRVIPTKHVLWSIDLFTEFGVVDLILLPLISCSYSCFRSLNWQSKRVHNHKGIANDLSLEKPHYLNVISGLGMHDHLDQGCG